MAVCSNRHVEHLRTAQATVMLSRIGAAIWFLLAAMLVGATLQVISGFGLGAALWQLSVGGVFYSAVRVWLSHSLRPAVVPIFAGIFGVCIAVLLTFWVPVGNAAINAFACVAGLLIASWGAMALQPVPVSMAAFVVPVWAASALQLVRAFPELGAAAAALFGLGTAAMGWLAHQISTRFAREVKQFEELVQLNRLLQEQKEIADAAVKSKSRFLAAASHDLRQPMHAISLYLGGLAEADLSAKSRSVVGDALECVHVMNDMFRSLLDLSRLDTYDAVPQLTTFCMADVLKRIEKEFTPLAQSQSVKLKVRGSNYHVYSDPTMVERIVQNFVSNAVRHSPKGRILVACRVRGRIMRVVVYDTGCGIPQERQKVIFEEFHRLDSSRQPDDTGGLGLGLSIVRRLAHALKVPVVVCSKPGRGSLFAIDLPLVNLAPRTITMERPEVSLAGRTVLVVDDDQRILDAVTFILKEVGCEVLPARSLKESLRVSFAAACVPDAIVCDFQLGGELNGGDVITALREEFNADIPALLVTGETEGREASRMAQALGVRLHHKPLVPVEFKRALNVALGEEGPTHG